MVEPVRVDVEFGAGPERVFRVFCDQMGRWWPLATHSVGGRRARTVHFPTEVGSAILEESDDGRLHAWGTVEVLEVGHRVAFSWHPGLSVAEATRVDVVFEGHGSGTRLRLVHEGWEARGDRAVEVRAQYSDGWPMVLEGMRPFLSALGDEDLRGVTR